MHTFYAIGYSPWSERARWALDHGSIAYHPIVFTPTLTDIRLRAALRRPLGRITVPVLFLTDGTVLEESLEIVRWVSRQDPERLPLGDSTDEVCAIANRLLEAGRVRTTHRALRDDALMKASLPSFMAPLGGAGVAIGRPIARRLLIKYPVGTEEACLEQMIEALEELRARIDGRSTIHRQFSCTDIMAATALAFVQPAPGPWAKLNETARQGWTEPELAERFADLLEWRDRLYQSYR
ncbi:MAG: glutathione S-transferase N-terminal domain-containing protein [Myxococcota bacterium]